MGSNGKLPKSAGSVEDHRTALVLSGIWLYICVVLYVVGGDSMVSSSWCSVWCKAVLNVHWYVVCWLYICRSFSLVYSVLSNSSVLVYISSWPGHISVNGETRSVELTRSVKCKHCFACFVDTFTFTLLHQPITVGHFMFYLNQKPV